jgi:hypothetical protein
VTSSALERRTPAHLTTVRAAGARSTPTAPVVRRTLGRPGCFFVAVIVFVFAGGLLASLGTL